MNIKDVELILEWVVYLSNLIFMNNMHAIYKFWIFEFWIILFKKFAILAYFDPITIFIIEITLKLVLDAKYGWNNPNWY